MLTTSVTSATTPDRSKSTESLIPIRLVAPATTVLESKYGSVDVDKDVGDLCRAEKKKTACFGLWAQMPSARNTSCLFGHWTLHIFFGEYRRWGIGCELGAGITARAASFGKTWLLNRMMQRPMELDGGRLSHLGVVYEAMKVLTNEMIGISIGIGFAYDMYALTHSLSHWRRPRPDIRVCDAPIDLSRLPSLRVKMGICATPYLSSRCHAVYRASLYCRAFPTRRRMVNLMKIAILGRDLRWWINVQKAGCTPRSWLTSHQFTKPQNPSKSSFAGSNSDPAFSRFTELWAKT